MKLFLLFFLLPLAVTAADYVSGTLHKSGSDFYILSKGEKLNIQTSEGVKKSLASLAGDNIVKQENGKKYAFEFKGEKNGDTFILEQVPTNIPGSVAIKGVLKYNSSKKRYEVNGKAAKFGYTKKLNGFAFDRKSRVSFIGKELIIEGDYDKNGVFVMQALTPTKLFSAGKPVSYPALNKHIEDIGTKKFLLNGMALDANSQGRLPNFRVTLYEDHNQPVREGESALLVTLSGRQGDSFGSVNGHFVAGLAEVKSDLELRAEVSNAYVTNGKNILSGNTSLTNYYSHTVQGQNNYRPTYTLIVYGVNKDLLKQFRDALEPSHIEFRTKELDITAQFNCTTETVKALDAAYIEGRYFQADNFLKGLISFPLKIAGNIGKTLNYALANDASRFQPRPAFESFVKAFFKESVREELGVKRVDYVFYNQIPSARPVGGMALGEPFKAKKYAGLYKKYEKDPKTKLSQEQLLIELAKELPNVSNPPVKKKKKKKKPFHPHRR